MKYLRYQAAVAAAVVLVLLFATWRYREVRADHQRARGIVALALDRGQSVSLEGVQEIEVADQPIAQAEILQSADGKVRLRYLSGSCAGATVWDNNLRTWRWYPKRETLAISAPRDADGTEHYREALLLNNFKARMDGTEEVAGHATYRIELRPKEPGGPWKRLWIAQGNFAILASEDFDANDRRQRATRFVRVTFDPPAARDDATFRPDEALVREHGRAKPGDSSTAFAPRELVDIVGFPLRLPSYLPAGYHWAAGYPFPCSCRHQAARLEFTNGLNTLAVFQCGHNCPPEDRCVAPNGSGLVVQLHDQNLALAATGEVPREELEKILRSVVTAPPVAQPKNPTVGKRTATH